MAAIGEVEKTNEFDCLKCGEEFQDISGVIYHDCPKKDFGTFDIWDVLPFKKQSEIEESPINESLSTSSVSRTSSFCKTSKVDSSTNFKKELDISECLQRLSLSPKNCYLEYRSKNACAKPLSPTTPKQLCPSTTISEDITPSCSLKPISGQSSKRYLDFNIQHEEGYSLKETKKVYAKSLSNELLERSSLSNKSKIDSSKCAMNLEEVDISQSLHTSNASAEKTSLQTEWGRLRYAKSLTRKSPEKPTASNSPKDD